MITYPLNVAVRILTARNYFLPQGITYRLPRLPILTARNYLPQGISSLVSLLVSSFGILTVRILTVSNFLELLTAALPQGIPYLLAVSRNYNQESFVSCSTFRVGIRAVLNRVVFRVVVLLFVLRVSC